MFLVVVFFVFVAVATPASVGFIYLILLMLLNVSIFQTYSSLREVVDHEYHLKINTTTTISITTEHNIIEKAKNFKKIVEDHVKAIGIIFASIIGAFGVLTTMVVYLIRCYKNNCCCKVRKRYCSIHIINLLSSLAVMV